jgi:cytochrome c553
MSNTRWLFQLRRLPHAALALAACGAVQPAVAQNAANGQVLYQQRVPDQSGFSCEDCHGPAYLFQRTAGAISTAISQDRGGMRVLYSSLTAAQISDIAAYMAAALPPPPPPPVTPPPGSPPPPTTPMASPNPVMFNSTQVGTMSPVVNVQFTNTSAANITLASPVISAATGHATDFLVATPTTGSARCIPGYGMAPGTSCFFGVQFAPSSAGARSATWTISFTGAVASRTLPLQGTATTTAAPAPAPAPAPSSANAPTSGGGGALGWLSLFGLAALSAIAGRRRR